MIRITQLKLPITHTEEELRGKVAKTLRVDPSRLGEIRIRKQSIDARKKSEVFYVYTVDVTLREDQNQRVNVSHILKKVNSNNIMLTNEQEYAFPNPGDRPLSHPPVIVGSGPAGLFCAYALASMGYAPIVLERGKQVQQRSRDVAEFWRTGRLLPDSNVQFGEGGAGTFSDGKLTTLVKDPAGRSRMVLSSFIRFGAPERIAYEAKPHIGTDVLVAVIEEMRREIIRLGGTFLFETCLVDLICEKNRICGVACRRKDNSTIQIDTDLLVLAIGHSARDTFTMLYEKGVPMEAKSFAVGFRVEHPQEMISIRQYGEKAAALLPPAPYKVTANLENGRGVYSFCMCPGGYVVNASSEQNMLAVNGMSYSRRDGHNANSAIIVSVTPDDFEKELKKTELSAAGVPNQLNSVEALQPNSAGTLIHPLLGVAFQRSLERKAYELGAGRIPQQLFGDFEQGQESRTYGGFESAARGGTSFAPLHELFGEDLKQSFIQGMHRFAKAIPDFDRYDCILSGVESRTSSPVRITRNETFMSSLAGLYPCGEGAGYAGGIMSAAMDGLKVAEAIIKEYKP